ncbi:MAG: hypothetical protein HYY31_05890, partial [Chloroflexi bacterium]|nr:hypothetical protein [Chloroflexota bacterium]
AWAQVVGQFLSDFVQNLGVVTIPRALTPRMRHIEVVYLQELLGLLLVVLQQARVRKELLLFQEPVTREEMVQVSNKLQGLYDGFTAQEIKGKSAELSPLEQQVRTRALELMEQEEIEQHTNHVVDGLKHLFSQPEFTSGVDPSWVASLVEDRRLVKTIATELPEPGEVRVLIGEENIDEALKPFSLVLAQYGITGEVQGAVAILGPTRLHYSQAIAGVRYFSELMSGLVGSLQSKAF